jgi:FkbM family methyltransferase
MQQFITPGELVFDVGACVGDNTDIYLAAGAGVIAIEPQPLCLDILKKKYAQDGRVAIAPYGIGDAPGLRELSICNEACPLSTFSQEWQEKSRYSQRHANDWSNKATVLMVTLDQLIDICGTPAFCKIDVENFEYEVFKGLSTALPALSFEFREETIENSKKCLEKLDSLGDYEYNFVMFDSFEYVLETWVNAHELLTHIRTISTENRFGELLCGDIYARLIVKQ